MFLLVFNSCSDFNINPENKLVYQKYSSFTITIHSGYIEYLVTQPGTYTQVAFKDGMLYTYWSISILDKYGYASAEGSIDRNTKYDLKYDGKKSYVLSPSDFSQK
jgi:hypothetical protein